MARLITMAPQARQTMTPQAPRQMTARPPQASGAVKTPQASTTPKTPQASATPKPTGKRPNGRTAPGTPPHHRIHPAQRDGRGGLVTVLLIVLAVAGAGLWYWLGGATATVDPGEQLQAQMAAAAQGTVVPTHAFGGALSVVRANGRANVVAEGVPSRACVQVGWRLAKEGTIIVNGTLPTRLSAARLSELCSGDAATLIWVPDE